MKLILYSLDDLAGSNIARIITNRYNFASKGDYYYGSPIYRKENVMLFGTHSSVRDLENIPYVPEACIVASRHKSDSGRPTLTCHPTGNFGKAELGGRDGRLQLTDALHLRQALMYLRQAKDKYSLAYDVSLEVTHHGPTELPFPLIYVEVGGTRVEWSDENACNAVAEVVYTLASQQVEKKPPAIGFGGPHYAPNFNQVAEHYALGHIMPKHAVENLTKTMVQEMILKTYPRPDVAAIDWKGLRGADRELLKGILNELGVNWIKTGELK